MVGEGEARGLFEAVELGLTATGAVLTKFATLSNVVRLTEALDDTIAKARDESAVNNAEVLAALTVLWLAIWDQRKSKENLI